jgi:hypothetical protein
MVDMIEIPGNKNSQDQILIQDNSAVRTYKEDISSTDSCVIGTWFINHWCVIGTWFISDRCEFGNCFISGRCVIRTWFISGRCVIDTWCNSGRCVTQLWLI